VTDASLALVRRYFLDYYDDLKRRLTKQLRSPELAAEALQDAWLKFARIETLGVVHNPRSYVFSVAMNAARDRRVSAIFCLRRGWTARLGQKSRNASASPCGLSRESCTSRRTSA
jgi:hypothetical protein